MSFLSDLRWRGLIHQTTNNDSQHDDLAEKREADARGASLSWLSDALVEQVFG